MGHNRSAEPRRRRSLKKLAAVAVILASALGGLSAFMANAVSVASYLGFGITGAAERVPAPANPDQVGWPVPRPAPGYRPEHRRPKGELCRWTVGAGTVGVYDDPSLKGQPSTTLRAGASIEGSCRPVAVAAERESFVRVDTPSAADGIGWVRGSALTGPWPCHPRRHAR